ncbi:MAG TPA: Fe-S cluster assembly protein SufD [Mariprofundaceae bacterium]|nr:Fe-S cluster assembly protein SufD [Mariprofundaceae bacterium]
MTSAVQSLRDAAWQMYEQAGLPTLRSEDWKYTDLAKMKAALGEEWWKPAEIDSASLIDLAEMERLAIPTLDAYRLLFVDGRFHESLSHKPAGIEILPLAEAIRENADLAGELLRVDETSPTYTGLVAANSALAADGACVRIKAGIVLDKPLLIQHVAGRPGAAHICHGLWLGERSEAHVIEHYCGVGETARLTHAVTRVYLEAAAVLRHDRLQMEQPHHYHLGRLEVTQQRDSSFESHSIALGAALSRVDLSVLLAGQGASCRLNGLYLIGGRQHADHHTRIEHAAPYCTSREHYRGVIDERAHGVFNGKVIVNKGAIKTDSAQSNANLLLSKFAEVDAKPELTIDNDDVKAAHGCTVGQLDKRQLFYLKSRGLSEVDARQVLTFAFADEVLASLKLPAVRRFVERAAFARLPHSDGLEEMLA